MKLGNEKDLLKHFFLPEPGVCYLFFREGRRRQYSKIKTI